MASKYKEDVEWVLKQVEQDKINETKYPDFKTRFPYEVVLVDQFQGHDEYGYDTVRRYNNLKDAVAAARKITEESLLRAGSVGGWHGLSDAGLVYHNSGKLVWDGIREYTNNKGSNEVFEAIDFATKAHAGQFRKGTTIPYITHPTGVSKILTEYKCTNKIVIAGILHDTIENTEVTYEEIKDKFGYYIAELVKNVTESDRSLPWRERKENKIKQLREEGYDVLLIACADKLDNIRAIRSDFSQLGEKLWKRFNSSKEDQRWYYQVLGDLFKEKMQSSKLQEAFILESKKIFHN